MYCVVCIVLYFLFRRLCSTLIYFHTLTNPLAKPISLSLTLSLSLASLALQLTPARCLRIYTCTRYVRARTVLLLFAFQSLYHIEYPLRTSLFLSTRFFFLYLCFLPLLFLLLCPISHPAPLLTLFLTFLVTSLFPLLSPRTYRLKSIAMSVKEKESNLVS